MNSTCEEGVYTNDCLPPWINPVGGIADESVVIGYKSVSVLISTLSVFFTFREMNMIYDAKLHTSQMVVAFGVSLR